MASKKTYGSIGICENCLKKQKLHGYVKGVLHCMKCYSVQRMKDPKKRAKQLEAVKKYQTKHADKVRKYNKDYHKKRYHADPLYKEETIERVKSHRRAKRKVQPKRKPGSKSAG